MTADTSVKVYQSTDAGAPDAKGVFPEGSVNARVVERLRAIAEMGQDDDEPEEPPAAAAKPARKKAVKKPAAEGGVA